LQAPAAAGADDDSDDDESLSASPQRGPDAESSSALRADLHKRARRASFDSCDSGELIKAGTDTLASHPIHVELLLLHDDDADEPECNVAPDSDTGSDSEATNVDASIHAAAPAANAVLPNNSTSSPAAGVAVSAPAVPSLLDSNPAHAAAPEGAAAADSTIQAIIDALLDAATAAEPATRPCAAITVAPAMTTATDSSSSPLPRATGPRAEEAAAEEAAIDAVLEDLLDSVAAPTPAVAALVAPPMMSEAVQDRTIPAGAPAGDAAPDLDSGSDGAIDQVIDDLLDSLESPALPHHPTAALSRTRDLPKAATTPYPAAAVAPPAPLSATPTTALATTTGPASSMALALAAGIPHDNGSCASPAATPTGPPAAQDNAASAPVDQQQQQQQQEQQPLDAACDPSGNDDVSAMEHYGGWPSNDNYDPALWLVALVAEEHGNDLKAVGVDRATLLGLAQRNPNASTASLAGVALLGQAQVLQEAKAQATCDADAAPQMEWVPAIEPQELERLEAALVAVVDTLGPQERDLLAALHWCEEGGGFFWVRPGALWSLLLACEDVRQHVRVDAAYNLPPEWVVEVARLVVWVRDTAAWTRHAGTAAAAVKDGGEGLGQALGAVWTVALQQKLVADRTVHDERLLGVLLAAALRASTLPEFLAAKWHLGYAQLVHLAGLLAQQAPHLTASEAAGVLLAAGRVGGLLADGSKGRRQRAGVCLLLEHLRAMHAAYWWLQRPAEECQPLSAHVLAGALAFFAHHPEVVADRALFRELVRGVLVAAGDLLRSSEEAYGLLQAALQQPLLRGEGGAVVVRHLADCVLPAPGMHDAWARPEVVALVGGLIARHPARLCGPEAAMGPCGPAVAGLTAFLLQRGSDALLSEVAERLVGQAAAAAAAAAATAAAQQQGASGCGAATASESVVLHDVSDRLLEWQTPPVGCLNVSAQVVQPVGSQGEGWQQGPREGQVAVGVCLSLWVPELDWGDALEVPLVFMQRRRVQPAACGQQQQQQQQQ